MGDALSTFAALLLKSAVVLLVANEVRGLVLAVPILYVMWNSGGTLMALWIGFCSLAGIALSVVVPIFVAKKLTIFHTRLNLRARLTVL